MDDDWWGGFGGYVDAVKGKKGGKKGSSKGFWGTGKGNFVPISERECYHCHRKGHLAADCPLKHIPREQILKGKGKGGKDNKGFGGNKGGYGGYKGKGNWWGKGGKNKGKQVSSLDPNNNWDDYAHFPPPGILEFNAIDFKKKDTPRETPEAPQAPRHETRFFTQTNFRKPILTFLQIFLA